MYLTMNLFITTCWLLGNTGRYVYKHVALRSRDALSSLGANSSINYADVERTHGSRDSDSRLQSSRSSGGGYKVGSITDGNHWSSKRHRLIVNTDTRVVKAGFGMTSSASPPATTSGKGKLLNARKYSSDSSSTSKSSSVLGHLKSNKGGARRPLQSSQGKSNSGSSSNSGSRSNSGSSSNSGSRSNSKGTGGDKGIVGNRIKGKRRDTVTYTEVSRRRVASSNALSSIVESSNSGNHAFGGNPSFENSDIVSRNSRSSNSSANYPLRYRHHRRLRGPRSQRQGQRTQIDIAEPTVEVEMQVEMEFVDVDAGAGWLTLPYPCTVRDFRDYYLGPGASYYDILYCYILE